MIVLDTHAWVWWLGDPERLGRAARGRIERELTSGEILVSTISVWEVLLLARKKKLVLTMEAELWVERAEALPFLRFVPLDNRIVRRTFSLPEGFHDDPADRFIVATAIELSADLITRDRAIRGAKLVRTIW